MSHRVLILLLITAAPAFGDDDPIRVAVFQGPGVGPSSEKLIAALTSDTGGKFKISRLTAEEIRDGKLADVDVLVHPGGSGSKQGEGSANRGVWRCRNTSVRAVVTLAFVGALISPRMITHGR